MREGPEEITIPVKIFNSCFGCVRFKRSLIRSGQNPIYENTCTHPEAPRRFFGENAISENLNGYPKTPDWCPFLNEK